MNGKGNIMMKGIFRKSGIGFLAFVMMGMTGLSWVGGAQANLINCSANSPMQNNFSFNDGCQYVTPSTGPGNDSQTIINNQVFFGSSNWTINGSVGSSPLLSGTQSGQSGSFTISGLSSILDALIIVKDGQGSTLVGYLYSADANGSYSWSSPYIGIFAQNGNPKDVSHLTLYTRGATSVPEPASLLLLGVGMAAIGIWRRKGWR